MTKRIFILIVLILLGGTAVFAYFKTPPEQQKESGTSAVISKLQEFKRLARFSVLIPNYIPEARRYELFLRTDQIVNRYSSEFDLISKDRTVTVQIIQHYIDPAFLAAQNDWDPAAGWPRSLNPGIGYSGETGYTRIPIGNDVGYWTDHSPGAIELRLKQGNIIIQGYINSSSLSLPSADRHALLKELAAIVASMK